VVNATSGFELMFFFLQENAHQEFINIIDGLQKENPALVDVAIKHYISQVNS